MTINNRIVQPCNMTGFLNASLFSQFGVVSIDWSNAKATWVEPPMSCEERLVEQAALLKAARPGVRVMGYRNIVKALPFFTSVREKMDDPAVRTTRTTLPARCARNCDPNSKTLTRPRNPRPSIYSSLPGSFTLTRRTRRRTTCRRATTTMTRRAARRSTCGSRSRARARGRRCAL
jgi:hypothetical protein